MMVLASLVLILAVAVVAVVRQQRLVMMMTTGDGLPVDDDVSALALNRVLQEGV